MLFFLPCLLSWAGARVAVFNYMENNSEQNSFKRAAGPVALTVLLVAAFAIASYSHTLGYPFQFDDHLYVIDYSRKNALADFWPPYGTRYDTYLSFALNYLLGGISTVGYHLTNLLIHIANGLLVCLFAVLTLKTPLMKKAGSAALPRLHIGILAALVFTSHPVQTEAITYISQRFASLATFFYLLAITLYLVWRMGGGGRKRAFAYALSLAFAVIAQKTKEISFTLPFMIVFFELAFFEGPLRSARRFLPLLPFISALAIIPLTIFGLDMGLWGGADALGEGVRHAQLRDLENLSAHDYLVTQFRVVVTYLRLLVLPVGQNLDYDYPKYASMLAPPVLLSFLFLLSVFSLSVYGFARSFVRKNAYIRLACLGSIWFFVTISVESSVIPIKDVIFEHRLYLPSVGAAIAFSSLAFYAVSRLGGSRSRPLFTQAAVVLVLLVAVPLAAASYARNSAWRDEVSLYEDTVAKSPEKERARYNLAWAYQRSGRLDRAAEEYMEVLRLKPDKAKAHYNLAIIYQSREHADMALHHFMEAARLDRATSSVAWYNMAMIYWGRGDARAAIDAYNEAITVNPAYEDAHYNLAWTYHSTGDNRGAVLHYSQVIRLNPSSADAYYNLGRVLSEEGMYAEAAERFRAALSINPEFADARTELEKIYLKRQGRDGER